MRIGLMTAALLASVVVGGTAVRAQDVVFTYSSPADATGYPVDFSFEVSATPTPILYGPGGTEVPVTDVSGEFGGSSVNNVDYVLFATGSNAAIALINSAVEVFGPQVFSGSTADPVFSPSTYMFMNEGEDPPTSGILTISSASAAPEPAAWLLMIAGMAGIGFAMRYAKSKAQWPFKDAVAV